MKLPTLTDEQTPAFEVAATVWVVQERERVQEARVLASCFELVNDRSKMVLIHTGYCLNVYKKHPKELYGTRFSRHFFPYEVFSTKEAVEELAKWRPVIATKDQWKKAIGGIRGGGVEHCEMGPCCADIGVIRELLLSCQQEGGLMEREVRKLKHLYETHPIVVPTPNLDLILDQLNIKKPERKSQA